MQGKQAFLQNNPPNRKIGFVLSGTNAYHFAGSVMVIGGWLYRLFLEA